jgi:hypothetical protein
MDMHSPFVRLHPAPFPRRSFTAEKGEKDFSATGDCLYAIALAAAAFGAAKSGAPKFGAAASDNVV